MFKQKDYKQVGFVSVVSFKEILRATKTDLNDEDMINLIQRLDKNITGMVNYNKFITEYLKIR
jgi:Ca2+-binding EF-hand superfamily protein